MAYIPWAEYAFHNQGYTPDITHTFPVVDNTAGRLEIEFNGFTPSVIVGVNVLTGVLDIAFSSLILRGPLVFISQKQISRRLWFFTIQAIDLLPDITIPISRFTETLSETELSKYNINVPDGKQYLNEVINRKLSTFTITAVEEAVDNSVTQFTSRLIPITGIRSDQGANNYSVSIEGGVEPEIKELRQMNVTGVSYLLNPADGKRTIRCDNNKDFNAGDTALFLGDKLISLQVTRIISSSQQTMQLTEA